MNSNEKQSFENHKNIEFQRLVSNINQNKNLIELNLSGTNFSQSHFQILLFIKKREKPLHILLCDCNIKLNSHVYDIIKVLKKRGVFILMNYSQKQMNQSIQNTENINFYMKESDEEIAFQKVPCLYTMDGSREIYNIEKVIHMWPKQQNNNSRQRPHLDIYTNDLWVKHQNLLIDIFNEKNYSIDNINKIGFYVQYSIIRACLFIFYEYLLKTYPFIINNLFNEDRSIFLYTIFIILLKSQDLDFIILHYKDTIQYISNVLKNDIELNVKPLPVDELMKNLGKDTKYMKQFNENIKNLIKIFEKIKKNKGGLWLRGIWESHPEWSEEDKDITMIDNNFRGFQDKKERISLTVADFVLKYKRIYYLIYN